MSTDRARSRSRSRDRDATPRPRRSSAAFVEQATQATEPCPVAQGPRLANVLFGSNPDDSDEDEVEVEYNDDDEDFSHLARISVASRTHTGDETECIVRIPAEEDTAYMEDNPITFRMITQGDGQKELSGQDFTLAASPEGKYDLAQLFMMAVVPRALAEPYMLAHPNATSSQLVAYGNEYLATADFSRKSRFEIKDARTGLRQCSSTLDISRLFFPRRWVKSVPTAAVTSATPSVVAAIRAMQEKYPHCFVDVSIIFNCHFK